MDQPLADRTILMFVGEVYEDLEVWYLKLRLIEAGARFIRSGILLSEIKRSNEEIIHMRGTNLVIVCTALVVAPYAVIAAPITDPSDLNFGDTYRLAFVSSSSHDAQSTNIADYNSFVATVAAGAPELAALGTTWKAIGSTASVDARDNTGRNPSSTGVPIYRLDGTRIASDNADLWDGQLSAALEVNEAGNFFPLEGGIFQYNTWTGTGVDGVKGSMPLGDTPEVDYGSAGTSTSGWIASNSFATTFSFNVYAISDVLTVVVPEPSSLFLVGIGATVVLGWQPSRRRQRN